MALPITIMDTGTVGNVDLPVLRLQQKTLSSADVQIKTDAGTPYQFEEGDSVVLCVLEAPSVKSVMFTQEGTVTDTATGMLNFTISSSKLEWPGVAYGEITLTRDSEKIKRWKVYVAVDITYSEDNTNQHYDPMDIGEIRELLRDRSPDENPLLNAVEFSDSQICWAIIGAVELYNSIGNPSDSYTTITFPYKPQWGVGVLGDLYSVAGRGLKRNQIASNVAGVQFDDSARADLYLRLGEQYAQEYETFVYGRKRMNNLTGWLGRTAMPSFGSRYTYGR